MKKYCLILAIVLILFSYMSGYSEDNVNNGSDFSQQVAIQFDHDLFLNQAVNGASLRGNETSDAPIVPDADRMNNTEDDTILAASLMKVSSTTKTRILLGVLTVMLLVSGSVTYWRKRKMNS
jgi:hypothetical protein